MKTIYRKFEISGKIERPVYLKNNGNKILHPAYNAWRHMLDRCYDEKTHFVQPWTTGSTVCEDWHDYNKFYDWRVKYPLFGCVVDKDLLVRGNKHYSPTTAIVLPKDINAAISIKDSLRSPYGYGVKKIGNKFKAVNSNKSFETAEQARIEYIENKHINLDKLAWAALCDGKINLEVYEKILAWEPR